MNFTTAFFILLLFPMKSLPVFKVTDNATDKPAFELMLSHRAGSSLWVNHLHLTQVKWQNWLNLHQKSPERVTTRKLLTGGHTMWQDTGLHVYPSHQRNSDSTDKYCLNCYGQKSRCFSNLLTYQHWKLIYIRHKIKQLNPPITEEQSFSVLQLKKV